MREILSSPVFIWLAVMVLFLVIEIATVGLTSIWFAGGALAALVCALAGITPVLQAASFLAVSLVLVFYTRPFALRFVNPHRVKTNYEDVIGREVQVIKRIDHRADTGTALCSGMEWSARSAEDSGVIEAGETAYVAEIRGVKLYVKRKKQEL